MPWEVKKDGEKWCIYKEGDDKSVACHDSESEANAQVRALYASEKAMDEEGEDAQPEQDAADPEAEGEAEEPVSEVATVEVPEGITQVVLKLPVAVSVEKSLTDRIWEGIKTRLGWKDETTPAKPITGGFKVYKGLSGEDRWIAWYSNNFEDRDSEFFSEKGIDAFVERVDKGLTPMPELWSWHEPGTRYGQADWVDRMGHYAIATGTYDDTPAGRDGKAYDAKHADEYGVSHGFLYQTSGVRLVDGHRVYEDFNTFEISPLPKDKAANVLTAFAVETADAFEEKSMTPEKRAHLVAKHGEEFVKGLEADTERLGKAHEALKGFKDFIQANTEQETAAEKQAVELAEKSFGELMPELVGRVADVAEAAVASVKAVQSADGKFEAKYADAMKQIDALREQMELRPRIASQDTSTAIDTSQGKGKELLETISKQMVERDAFWSTEVTVTP